MLLGSFAVALPLMGTTACGIFGGGDVGPASVDELVSWVERVYVDCELSQEKSRVAVERLQEIVSSEFAGDAVSAYAAFVEAVERAEKQALKLRESVEPMKAAAGPVFEHWYADLQNFRNAEMRQRSRARFEATRARYEAIVSAVDPAQTEFDELNVGLRDHALFLGNDFNPASVSALTEDARGLAHLSADLDTKFESCLLAARTYIESTALPVSDMQDLPAQPGGAGPSGDLSAPREPRPYRR